MATVIRSFRLSTALDARLLAEAARQDRSASWMIVRALEAALPDETPRLSPAGREAKTETASEGQRDRPAVTRQGASRPSASPRTSTRKKAAPSGDGTPLPKIARKHWA